jgi:hypothetical protein
LKFKNLCRTAKAEEDIAFGCGNYEHKVNNSHYERKMIMNKNLAFLCLALLTLVMLSGCNLSKATIASPQPTMQKTPLPSLPQETSLIPSFEIVGLHNGDILAQSDLNLQVILSNFTLVDRNSEMKSNSNQGHIHYWLDANPTDPGAAVQVDKDPEHIILSQLKPGEHILTMKLVGTDHKPMTETTTQILTFMVQRPNSTEVITASPSPAQLKPTLAPATIKPTNTPIPTAVNNTGQVNQADSTSASFTITGLKNGDIVTTEDLKFGVDIKGLTMVNFDETMEPKAGEGHIHIWLDTTSTEAKSAFKNYNDPRHIVIKHIAEGEHTILIGLVSNDHQMIIGQREAITFNVKRS